MSTTKVFTPDFNGERFDSGMSAVGVMQLTNDRSALFLEPAFPHLDANIDLGALAAYDDGNHADA